MNQPVPQGPGNQWVPSICYQHLTWIQANKTTTTAIHKTMCKEALDVLLAYSGLSLWRHLSLKMTHAEQQPCTLANCPFHDVSMSADVCGVQNTAFQVQWLLRRQYDLTTPHMKDYLTTNTSSFCKNILKCSNATNMVDTAILATERNTGNLRIEESFLIHHLNLNIDQS